MSGWLPSLPPALAADGHKGDAGRVFCLCGSRRMPGAAMLVVRAAQRAGAGIVALGCLDPELLALVPLAAPEAIYTDLFADLRGEISTEILGPLLANRDDHARVAGPGLGDTPRTRALVEGLLEDPGCVPLVLDADALNCLQGEPERMAKHAGPVVITPHPGEAARLLGRPIPRDEDGRVESARELARCSGAVCCLKGARSVVSDGERVYTNDTGNPGMATGGAGDVLAGVLATYLGAWRASGADAEDAGASFEAAAAAVRVHGRAGDLAAAQRGRRAVVASDLIDALGAAQLWLGDVAG